MTLFLGMTIMMKLIITFISHELIINLGIK